MASRIEPLLTVVDLDACPDDNNRYELIGGELSCRALQAFLTNVCF